jgi:hypothetical protein
LAKEVLISSLAREVPISSTLCGTSAKTAGLSTAIGWLSPKAVFSSVLMQDFIAYRDRRPVTVTEKTGFWDGHQPVFRCPKTDFFPDGHKSVSGGPKPGFPMG